jgi:glycosyltransferase involved in cell wall biosynthesis
MNVLVLSSRFPWPPFTGDRLRATIWLAALEREANVTLVSPAGDVPAGAPRFAFEPLQRSLTRGIAGAFALTGRGAASSLFAGAYDWRGAIARAERKSGGFDATVVLLSRLDPAVRAHLPRGLHILDAIDSLRLSIAERARQAPLPLRALWRVEERRIAGAEQDAARAYDRVLVVSPDEAADLGATAIGNGVEIRPLGDAPRKFDFGFWGRLPYFANADAVTWLLGEIWPAIRAARPDATLLIAGYGAPRRVRAAHGSNGVSVQSPVADIAAATRQVRVALFPMRYGTGQMNKALEAAEAGCALVATPHALRGLAPLAAHASLAGDADALARLAVNALDDRTAGRALRAVAESTYSRAQTLARLAAVVVAA